MKKISLALFIVVLLLCFSCSKDNAKDGTKNKYKTMADALNKQCPTMIGDEIQLDAVEYTESSHTLQYVYSFTSMVKEDNTVEGWGLIEAATRDALISEFKDKTNINQFRKDKLSMAFVYKDKNKERLFTVVLKPEEY